MAKIAPYAKAIVAALVAGLTALIAAEPPLDTRDYLTAAVALLVSAGAVFSVPNTTK